MAPVTRPHDRGQLILVAGLTVAVILVMLVLLLNTVIYTENLATRGIDSGAADAIEYRATVVGSVEELIEHENERYDEGYPPVCGSPCIGGVDMGINAINDHLRERHLRRGVIAEVQYDSEDDINKGTLIVWQTNSDAFPSGETSDWTLANEVNDVRDFEIVVDTVELAAVDPFSIVIDDWVMQIKKRENAESAGNTELVVTVKNAEQGPEEIIESEGPLVIDLAAGTVNGADISPKPTFTGSSISLRNGSTATGTLDYRSDGVHGDANEYSGVSGNEPYYTYTVDSVILTIHYETSRVRFISEETIDPEDEP